MSVGDHAPPMWKLFDPVSNMSKEIPATDDEGGSDWRVMWSSTNGKWYCSSEKSSKQIYVDIFLEVPEQKQSDQKSKFAASPQYPPKIKEDAESSPPPSKKLRRMGQFGGDLPHAQEVFDRLAHIARPLQAFIHKRLPRAHFTPQLIMG